MTNALVASRKSKQKLIKTTNTTSSSAFIKSMTGA
jgi:hypothetical protein